MAKIIDLAPTTEIYKNTINTDNLKIIQVITYWSLHSGNEKLLIFL